MYVLKFLKIAESNLWYTVGEKILRCSIAHAMISKCFTELGTEWDIEKRSSNQDQTRSIKKTIYIFLTNFWWSNYYEIVFIKWKLEDIKLK